jgi:hypothetical protein
LLKQHINLLEKGLDLNDSSSREKGHGAPHQVNQEEVEKARGLTCDDVQVSIFGFVVGMLRVLATVLVHDRLVLNQLVLLAESNVAVGVKLRDGSREILDVNGAPRFAADDDRCFEVNIGRRLWLVGVVQVVVVGVQTLSVCFNGSKKRFKSCPKHLSHRGTSKLANSNSHVEF